MKLLARLFWIPATLGLGLLPSLTFFVWAEGMARYPAPGFAMLIPWALGWPVLELGPASLGIRAAVDAGLILAFGVLHTVLAQVTVHRWVSKVTGGAQVRALYVIVTGLSLVGVMVCWQPLGRVAWHLVPGSPGADRAGQIAYYLMLVLAGFALAGPGLTEFLGLASVWRGTPLEERTAGNPVLIESGLYARVRHPVYTFTLGAFLMANAMTLDRLVIFLASLAYLAVAVPLEERKLVQLFGAAYEDYRRRVPALIPRLTRAS